MMRATMRGLVTSWTLCCFGYLLLGTIQTGTQTNLAVSVCLFSLIASWAVWSVTGRRRPSTSHGSASWADTRALQRVLRPASRALEPGALALGLRGWRQAIVLPPDLARLHVLVVGGSGSGKTWGFFLPNAAHARGSFVATDPRGELWHHTSGYHQNAWRFAPREPEASRGFNWIPLCREEYIARLLAAAALQVEEDPHEEQFWKLAELQLCTALFAHAARTKVPTPATVWQLLRLGPRDLLEPLKQSPASAARTCAALLADQKPEARAGIVLGVVNKLAFLEDRRSAASRRPISPPRTLRP